MAEQVPPEAPGHVLPFPSVGTAGNPVKDAIRKAKKPDKPPEKPGKLVLYLEKDGVICKRNDKSASPLCNFTARIAEEVTHDNGEETALLFAIEGRLSNGQALPRIEVPAGSYGGMAWVVSQWGSDAYINAGNTAKDHLRAAIQELSTGKAKRTVYSHTGWRQINGEWFYLHCGGGIGKDGNRADIEVNPGAGHMRHYRLPDPPQGEARQAAIKASLGLLQIAPRKPEIGALLLACVYRAPTAAAALIDHTALLFGYTGARKSELAAMALAHFGQGFNARSFPAAWADTPAALELKAHAAKDALFVVDDFKPHGGKGEIDRLHATADKLIRGAGNQSGRGRLQSDLKQRAAYYARGLVLSTGEDIPRGQSCRARITIASLSRDAADPRNGDVDLQRLSELQTHARSGALAGAMAAYLQWLAPQIDTLKETLPEAIRASRDQAAHSGLKGHSRAPSDLASLCAGLVLFARFAQDCGALGEDEAGRLLAETTAALRGLIEAQDEHQASQDEVARFLALLASALSSGRCHAFDLEGGDKGLPRGPHARAYGWTQDASGEHRPQGQCIGYLEGDALYLDGEAAYAVAAKYASDQGGAFEISQRTVFARIFERGLLAQVEREASGKTRHAIQKRIHGKKARVYALRLSALADDTPPGQP